MCGIAGIRIFGGAPRLQTPELLSSMAGSLRHRGPDESGIYLDDHVGLGHTRLSIIGLADGTQPISNEDQTLWIVFNGEIFNYVELRQELVARGHLFRTTTDTEVILHLYEEEGTGCLARLNGQFALAIWDLRRRDLILARDRIGILPLCYALQADRLLFASEVKALFASGLVDRQIDPVAMDQVFTFWTTLPGRTPFRGVSEIPPGHVLVAGETGVALRKYWEPDYAGDAREMLRSPAEAARELSDLLRDAVRIRLRADVPVGCYISGGLDSSGVAAIVKRHFKNRLRTFGIRFEEKAFDETPHQAFIVNALGTEHTPILVSNDAISRAFPDVVWHAEKPLLRTAPVPLYLLSKAVRENGFKVVLTGEGADEVFGGYNIFLENKIRRFWARQPDSRIRPLLVNRLYRYVFDQARVKSPLQAFFARGLENVDDPLYSHLIRWENTKRIRTFFSPGLREAVGDYDGYEEVRRFLPASFGAWDPLARAQYLETSIFLATYLLSSQGDRVAMANAVEIRPPYLDHRIVEFMGRIPAHWKIRGLNEKYLLKMAFEGILPREVLDRPKHPYRAPIQQSFLGPDRGETVDVLTDEGLRSSGLFDPAKVGLLLRKCAAAAFPNEVDGMALAGILSAQTLHDRFIARFLAFRPEPLAPDVLIDRRSSDDLRPEGRRSAGAAPRTAS